MPIDDALPDELVARLPEPRRTLHRRAVEVIDRHRREGAPYALVLRSYGTFQLLGGPDGQTVMTVENVLFDALDPAGIGVIQVQPPTAEPAAAVLYDVRGGRTAVRAPSLYLEPDRWQRDVVPLVAGAELIVIVLPRITAGVGLELDAVRAAGRVDRSVVLVPGADLGGPEDGTVAVLTDPEIPDTGLTMLAPVLRRFPRVLWVGDLDRAAPLSSFVFSDLIDRLHAIARVPGDRRREMVANGLVATARPVDLTGVMDAYEQLAPEHRRLDRSDVAALYYGLAARHATDTGRVSDAVESACAHADLLAMFGRADAAHDTLLELGQFFDGWAREHGDDAGFVREHATLVAEQARMLTHMGRTADARRLLAEQTDRCSTPRNPVALSTLHTALAWTLRAGTDPDAVLAAGSAALRLAEEAGDGHAAGRALTVLGATLHDLRDLEHAESYLVNALDRLPALRHQDRWRALLRLGEVLQARDRTDDARTALRMAAEAATQGGYGWCAGLARDRLTRLG